MKRLLFIIAIMAMVTMGFSQEVLDGPGPYWLWEGDTLKGGESFSSAPTHTGHWAYMGLWIKTTNPVDSTKYRVYFKGTLDTADIFAIPSDTLGNENGNTIMRISDTLWHYCSIKMPCAMYTKIYIDADNTDHGDRARVWSKIFLWRPGYWRE